tara:strand:+ start:236 stop:577 length:342 start_codon:yes stop_codon:yes gene_type:complete
MKITKQRLRQIIKEELAEGTIEREMQLYDTDQLIEESVNILTSVNEQLNKVMEIYNLLSQPPHVAEDFGQLKQALAVVLAAMARHEERFRSAEVEHTKKKEQAAQQSQTRQGV